MNKVLFLLLWVVSIGNVSAQSDADIPVLGTYALPDSGFQTASFSACPLYKYPSKKSPVIEHLPMNASLTIDTTIQVDYSKLENRPEFYKVRYKGKKGYIQSTELANYRIVDSKTQTTFLFYFNTEQEQHLEEDYTEYHYNLFYKELYNNTIVQEGYLKLNDDFFQLFLTDPRGLTDIDKLFIIDYFSEACGEDGGQDYYTWTPGNFNFIAHMTEVGDGGVFYFVENLIFPSDSTGEPNKIKYESIEFELLDEETNWFTENHNYRTYNWVDGVIQPPFKREYSLEE
jgi:hypothetical protein